MARSTKSSKVKNLVGEYIGLIMKDIEIQKSNDICKNRAHVNKSNNEINNKLVHGIIGQRLPCNKNLKLINYPILKSNNKPKVSGGQIIINVLRQIINIKASMDIIVGNILKIMLDVK